MAKLYNNIKKDCAFGYYDESVKAGYTVTDAKGLKAPWYYIYQNRKVLLYLDQNGPVKLQYEPPSGILIFKRELGETQSKWQVWVQSKDINEGVPVSNFNSPNLRYDLPKPKYTINWEPTRAVYTSEYKTAKIITEIFVPSDKATVSMKTTVLNTSDKEMDITVTPSVFPYVNVPQMVAWDLPEWYLSTKIKSNGKALTFAGQMLDPLQIKEGNRAVSFNLDYDENAFLELDMAGFVGNGSFFSPTSVIENTPYTHAHKDAVDKVSFGGVPTVWATRYKANLKPGESKTYTQVITVHEDYLFNDSENAFEQVYFDEKGYEERIKSTEKFYEELFTKRTIKTSNKLYDNFINNFAPLQMYWVCSLDRGWPSSMRGIRDCSQDFMGMLPLDPTWTKKAIIEMFEHQRTDGWMPRQISTISRTAPHDMRYYCDGGAFLLELINEYFTFTRDFDFLNERCYWLDSDEQSTILEHIERTIGYYLDPINIGEHCLCKVWYGDWWDPMDKIGMDGIGESVTVTAQNVLNLINLADMFKHLCKIGKLDKSYLNIAENYLEKREGFIKAMREHAYNSKGFFNGYFNDNRKWICSDNDPDGVERMYLVSNAWAVISGSATKEMADSVINYVVKNDYDKIRGHFTTSKGFPTYIDKCGRKGNGTQGGLATYNHAQSFFVRASAVAGYPDIAYNATKHILPIDSELLPVEKTFAPPYAIANCYGSKLRAGFQFLSGTVSYVLRTVYNFFFGVTYEYDGLSIRSSMPSDFGDALVSFEYLGKKFTLKYYKTDSKEKAVKFNGKAWTKTKKVNETGREVPFIEDGDMQLENLIEIEY